MEALQGQGKKVALALLCDPSRATDAPSRDEQPHVIVNPGTGANHFTSTLKDAAGHKLPGLDAAEERCERAVYDMRQRPEVAALLVKYTGSPNVDGVVANENYIIETIGSKQPTESCVTVKTSTVSIDPTATAAPAKKAVIHSDQNEVPEKAVRMSEATGWTETCTKQMTKPTPGTTTPLVDKAYEKKPQVLIAGDEREDNIARSVMQAIPGNVEQLHNTINGSTGPEQVFSNEKVLPTLPGFKQKAQMWSQLWEAHDASVQKGQERSNGGGLGTDTLGEHHYQNLNSFIEKSWSPQLEDGASGPGHSSATKQSRLPGSAKWQR